LISLALTPAPVTYTWLERGPKIAPHLAEALDKVSLIEAPTRKEEAAAIALCLRKAVQDGRKSALITPDRDLARRVAAELSRWAILPDDSGGEPLHLTPPGIFLRLVADMFGKALTPRSFISLLKHPLTDSCMNERVSHLQYTRKLEIELRDGRTPEASLEHLAGLVAEWGDPAAGRWIGWISSVLQDIDKKQKVPLSNWVSLHRTTAEAIAAGESGSDQNELWRKDAGEKAQRLLDELAGEADAGGTLTAGEYRALLDTVLQAQSERDAAITHPLVSIWGTLEARVQGADLVVLGGLNEGTWPKMPRADPWMNRIMRQQIGLPLPERQIGLSAHDFQQACGGAEIVWSRSLRDGDAPSVASRWIIRITNLLDGLGDTGKEALEVVRARGGYWLDLAKAVERPEAVVEPATRPSPRVPPTAKPSRLSVTRIAPLINDPYQIYADAVLKLKPLDPLTPEMDAKVRGTVFHEILEAFSMPGVELTEAELIRIARQKLEQHVGPPETRELWLGRIATLAGWIAEEEAKRQERCPESWREIRGTRDLPALDFTLSAKADRIGRTPSDELVVYDYKTGAAPSPKEIERYEKQLPLEAAIIATGGFPNVPAHAVTALEYMSLASGGKTSSLSMRDADGGDLVETTWRDFERLITTVKSDTFGFTARDRPANIKYPSDYDHLARFGEWQDTDPPVPEDMT
jgi:double-strand break repair protein AddB